MASIEPESSLNDRDPALATVLIACSTVFVAVSVFAAATGVWDAAVIGALGAVMFMSDGLSLLGAPVPLFPGGLRSSESASAAISLLLVLLAFLTGFFTALQAIAAAAIYLAGLGALLWWARRRDSSAAIDGRRSSR